MPDPKHTVAKTHRFLEALDRAATTAGDEVDTTLESMLQIHGGRSATLAAGAAERLQLSPKHIKTVDALLSALNDHAREGHVVLSPKGTVALAPLAAKGKGTVKVKAYWWGVKITMTHAVVKQLSAVGGAVGAILVAAGLAAWIVSLVGAVIAALAAALKSLDKGKGVWIKITSFGIPAGFGAL